MFPSENAFLVLSLIIVPFDLTSISISVMLNRITSISKSSFFASKLIPGNIVDFNKLRKYSAGR